jgi:glycerophosphoryl diester phosphodiesterase
VSLTAALTARPFAHRGLWAPGGERPENSLAAFEAACQGGYGIEMDVQLSADGEAVVFHDADLLRMTTQAGIVEERPVDELTGMRLMGGAQTIPTLAQALAEIAGRGMVLIELKTPPGQEGLLERRVLELVAGYSGPFALIGFNHASHAWLAKHAPDLPRGLNITPRTVDIASAAPHFLLPSLDSLALDLAQSQRAEGMALVAWTVRTAQQRDTALPLADNIIFEGPALEGFRP